MNKIAHDQMADAMSQQFYNSNKDYCVRATGNIAFLFYNAKHLIIPKVLQRSIVTLYHHYLQNSGHSCLQETIKATMYLKTIYGDIKELAKRCIAMNGIEISVEISQPKGYSSPLGVLVCGYHSMLKGNNFVSYKFMCITKVDPNKVCVGY